MVKRRQASLQLAYASRLHRILPRTRPSPIFSRRGTSCLAHALWRTTTRTDITRCPPRLPCVLVRTAMSTPSRSRLGLGAMEYRHLGKSGLKVSEIAYGNWITHGSQVEEESAVACVRAALDEGITTFDTADVYAGGRAEEVMGRALDGVRRESIEICTKVYWPTRSEER